MGWVGVLGRAQIAHVHAGAAWVQNKATQTSRTSTCLSLNFPQGYMVGEFSIDFKINLNITTTTLVGNATAAPGAGGNATNPVPAATGSSSEVLSITPSVPFQRDASRRVSAKLLGDLASYRQEVQLEGKWLLIPFALGRCMPRGGACLQRAALAAGRERLRAEGLVCRLAPGKRRPGLPRTCIRHACRPLPSHFPPGIALPAEQYPNRSFLSSRRNEWMVVDPSMVSMDGSQCNKIGTSYGWVEKAGMLG